MNEFGDESWGVGGEIQQVGPEQLGSDEPLALIQQGVSAVAGERPERGTFIGLEAPPRVYGTGESDSVADAARGTRRRNLVTRCQRRDHGLIQVSDFWAELKRPDRPTQISLDHHGVGSAGDRDGNDGIDIAGHLHRGVDEEHLSEFETAVN